MVASACYLVYGSFEASYDSLPSSLSKVRMKPAPFTPMDKEGRAMQHQPVFGIHDVSSEKLKQEKDRARSLFLEQLSMVASKQQRMKEKALQDHHEEADMLKRTRNR